MRIVVKIGTSLIAPQGRIDTNRLRALVDQFDLNGNEYLIVSSGAIASGMSRFGLAERPTSVPLMQACAAVDAQVEEPDAGRNWTTIVPPVQAGALYRATSGLAVGLAPG